MNRLIFSDIQNKLNIECGMAGGQMGAIKKPSRKDFALSGMAPIGMLGRSPALFSDLFLQVCHKAARTYAEKVGGKPFVPKHFFDNGKVAEGILCGAHSSGYF